MDGLQRRLSESVQLKLSFTLSLAILGLAIVAGIVSYLAAFDEAHDLQDDVLRQVAQLMDRQRLSPAVPNAIAHPGEGDEESRVFVQRLGETDPTRLGEEEGDVLPLPLTLKDGLQTADVAGESFRILVRTTAAGERIAVAQESGLRNEIARDGALRTVTPFLILVPVLLLIVASLVRSLFRPIAQLAEEIDQRAEQSLHAIDANVLPTEVRPFVVAINHLLTRIGRSMETQRRFVADAAHELRSPLTALSLQAERLAETELPATARERLLALQLGIDRGRNLLDQLLSLARAQSAAEAPTVPLSIQGIYRRVLEDLLPLAEAKHLDVGVEGTEDAYLVMAELDLLAMVKNLVDNAIRYTPAGGRIDLSTEVRAASVVLRIQDTGPGIPEEDRGRVFDPFYRRLGSEETGSGLGLAIVDAIAGRAGARVHLDYTDPIAQIGLRVEVHFPQRAG